MKKYRRKQTYKKSAGLKANQPNPGIIIEDILRNSIKLQRKLEILKPSSIAANESRTVGANYDGPGLISCKLAGIHTGVDICHTTLSIAAKHVRAMTDSRARANGILASLKRAFKDNNELGILEIPVTDLKALKLDNLAPAEPAQLTEEQIRFVRLSRKGKTKFDALRNEIIADLELLRAIRPGMEIVYIDNDNVHPEDNYIKMLRDDGLMHNVYIRRDTSDKMVVYKRMRAQILNRAGAQNVKAFFIRNEARRKK